MTRDKCCEKHLVKKGHGKMIKGVYVNNVACRDGETERCGVCGTLMRHVCDETEGCSWRKS
jgi:hypothetical protein